MNIPVPPKGDAVATQIAFQQIITRNGVGSVTLTENTTTTTVTDPAFESSQVPVLVPTTANAAAALSTTYVSSRANGSFVLTHANNAQTDREFLYIRAC